MYNVWEKVKDRIQGKAEVGQKRSGKWQRVKKAHKKKYPKCAICESTTKLQVHHIVPFNIAPDLELDPENLVTLCENKKYGLNCHLTIGHLGNYRRTNANIVLDAYEWNYKLIKSRGKK